MGDSDNINKKEIQKQLLKLYGEHGFTQKSIDKLNATVIDYVKNELEKKSLENELKIKELKKQREMEGKSNTFDRTTLLLLFNAIID